MNKEEIDYWLRYFSNHNHGFMSEDGKKITLFKMFQELKELQYLLKIKNDYIKELQQENQSLRKENKILRENAEHNDKVVDRVDWENQKLKKELEEYKLITIDYQELEARNQELKKQIEGIEEIHKDMTRYALDNEAKIDELKYRIDKAIEYVKEHRYYAHTIDIDYLLEILRGDINE